MTYPYGIHQAIVCVDSESYGILVERAAVACDVGNSTLIEGQLFGGVDQRIGGALLEDFVYDDKGDLLTASFVDYLLPTVHDVPASALLVTEAAPSLINPLGVKGAGEGGITAAGVAIRSRRRRRRPASRFGGPPVDHALRNAPKVERSRHRLTSSTTRPKLRLTNDIGPD